VVSQLNLTQDKLKGLRKKAFFQIMKFMRTMKYEQVPSQVIDELNKYGLKKEEDESMDQFVDKVEKYCHDKEHTI
jgi:hypothetical protein